MALSLVGVVLSLVGVVSLVGFTLSLEGVVSLCGVDLVLLGVVVDLSSMFVLEVLDCLSLLPFVSVVLISDLSL